MPVVLEKNIGSGIFTELYQYGFDGLQETVARLIAGETIKVNTDGFQNDFETFESADDVLTLLIHLGYLTYHEAESTIQIPNEEVRIEFRQFLSQKKIIFI